MPHRSSRPHRHTAAGQGESAPFHFETTWRVGAGVERTWEVLSDLSAWPRWWPGMRAAHLSRDGSRAALTVQSPFGYRLNFTLDLVDSRPPRTAGFTASGDLRGAGGFRAEPDGTGTRMTIMWCVVTSRRLLSGARPFARLAHGLVMAAGQWGLRRVCSAPRGSPG